MKYMIAYTAYIFGFILVPILCLVTPKGSTKWRWPLRGCSRPQDRLKVGDRGLAQAVALVLDVFGRNNREAVASRLAPR